MGVLINEFEIVPPSAGDAGRKPDDAGDKGSGNIDKFKAQDVKTLLQRCEERRVRVLAH